MSEFILEAEGIHTHIGQHHILQGVSFAAPADAVTVLIGRNGAGKSTTLKTVMGLLPTSKGKIFYNGQEIQNKKPYQIARMGIGFVPEHMGIFSDLTVEENMQVAMLREDGATRTRLEQVLEMFAALRQFWKSKAGNLSGGQKQMLAIARAIVNDIALSIDATSSAIFGGGGNPINLSTVDMVPGATLAFLAETPAAFMAEHLGKLTINGQAAVDGVNIEINTFNGASGSIITVIPEPSTSVLVGLAGLALLSRRRR